MVKKKEVSRGKIHRKMLMAFKLLFLVLSHGYSVSAPGP